MEEWVNLWRKSTRTHQNPSNGQVQPSKRVNYLITYYACDFAGRMLLIVWVASRG